MTGPIVEMLWESADPLTALRERLGHDDGPATARWVADALRDHYGIAVTGCERVVLSDRNALAWLRTDAGPLVVKWCVAPERFGRLADIARLTTWLDAEGAPVSAPLLATCGDAQVETDGVSLGVQRVVTGQHLDVADPVQVAAAGAAVARLHAVLARYPGAVALDTPGTPLREHLTRWLASPPGHLPTAAVARLRDLLGAAPAEPGRAQLVHGDIRAANILWHNGSVTAFLDLDDVRADHPVADLARGAVLLGTLFRDWGPVRPEVHRTFRRGYESVRPLTPAESAWWPTLVLWWSLLMTPAGDDPTGWREAALALLP